MRNRYSYWAAPMVLAATLAPFVHGGLVQVRDAVGGEDTDGTPNGYYKTGLGSRPQGTPNNSTFGNLNTGPFDLETDYGGGFVPLVTYCIEPLQGIGFGLNPPDSVGAQYSIGLLHNSPGLTMAEAGYLQILWANAFADSLTSKTKSAAFQAIIWEFAQDATINLTSGQFKLNTADAYTATVRTTAQGWLDNITGGTWTSSVQLIALSNPDSQDFVALAVPTPGSLALLGLCGCISLSRRRRSV